jgi:hypothetical protein
MANTLRFGKYKGYTIAEVLTGDPEYLQWLCSQDEFRINRRGLHQDIIDCAEGLVDAPERKAMCARFQDVDFCRRFLQASGHKALLLHELEAMHVEALEQLADRLRSLKEATDKAKNYTDDPSHQAWARTWGVSLDDPAGRERHIMDFERITTELHALHKRLPSQVDAPEPKVSCRFERHGFDLVMRASIRYPWESELRKHGVGFRDGGVKRTVAIKIRWTVGNNYPATLRWIRWNRDIPWGSGCKFSPIADHVVLLVGRFNGSSAAKEQFVREAAAGAVGVVFAADIEAH